MAIYHLAIKSVSRTTGRSAVAASAYRSGERLVNERDGATHDYRNRTGVEDTFIVAPDGAAWAHDRSALWNAAEAAEKRKDAKVAREYELALPDELTAGQRRALVQGFAGELRDRYGVAVDVAIHRPHDHGDDRNHHAHLLTTTRVVEPGGLTSKTRQLDVATTASIEAEAVRANWAERVNAALEQAQVVERVDHRSYERRGKAIEPTIKLGAATAAIERREQRSAKAEGKDYEPVTLRGVFNAAVTEARRLSVYIERGSEWLREIGRRAREPAARIAGLAEVAAQTLRQAAQERQAAEAAREKLRQERHASELARQAVKPEPTIVPKLGIKGPSIATPSKGRGFSR